VAGGGGNPKANGFIFAYEVDTFAASKTRSLADDSPKSRTNMVALSSDGSYLVAGADQLYLFKRVTIPIGPPYQVWEPPKTKLPCSAGDWVQAVAISDNCAAQKFRIASRFDRYDGQIIRLTFMYARLCMRCSLRGAGRNRWTRARGRDELGTDRNQRILPPTPLVSILANHPLSHRKLNGYFFPTATSRVGRDV
jgi:hypothetical protein